MFAPSFARAVRSTATIPSAPAGSICRAALTTASTPFRPLHQRRYSSSKSSIPPSNKTKPVEDVGQNAATQVKSQDKDARTKDKVTEVPLARSTTHVSPVPSTTHRHEDDVRLSSFFDLHRPIAFHRDAWQQPATMADFEAVFQHTESVNVKSIERTQNTLGEFLQDWYASMNGPEVMQDDAVFFLEDSQPLDAALTEESIKFQASQLPHFTPPPPPVAFDPSAAQYKPQRITEVALPLAPLGPATREYRRRRRAGMRAGMLLISVKRQRKLKMKKHKYKKLMKRTRLLRRKLDRT